MQCNIQYTLKEIKKKTSTLQIKCNGAEQQEDWRVELDVFISLQNVEYNEVGQWCTKRRAAVKAVKGELD